MASTKWMIQILRGKIGDKAAYHHPLWYSDEELEDQLQLAMYRHNKNLKLQTLPEEQMMAVCYLAAVDLCHDLAAKNAPFAINQIEGITVDKSGVMGNWLNLANTFREFYQLEMQGGIGSEGMILQGDLSRQSLTTGREVPYYNVRPFDPVSLSLKDLNGNRVTLSWTPLRDTDFFSYDLYRRRDNGEWEFLVSIFDVLINEYFEDVPAQGTYDYRIDLKRGVSNVRTTPYPWNPQVYQYLITPSNILTVQVV